MKIGSYGHGLQHADILRKLGVERPKPIHSGLFLRNVAMADLRFGMHARIGAAGGRQWSAKAENPGKGMFKQVKDLLFLLF